MSTHIEHTKGAQRVEAPPSRSYGSSYHTPVLLPEVLELLVTDPAGVYVDATLGGGGHTEALLETLGPDALVVGIDQDDDALREASERLKPDHDAGRFRPIKANFARLTSVLSAESLLPVDGVLLDLGVSSHQIDEPGRGFSFQEDGPLDMRMDPTGGLTARDIVNEWSEADLRQLLYDFGEERQAPRISTAIVEARPLETTTDLGRAVRKVTPSHQLTKTLARVFQALRIAVNREMEALESALKAGTDVLRPGGHMVVISYHSLEDRRVKRFFRYGNFDNEPVRDFYGNLITPWKQVVKGPVRPNEDEVEANPRARSARLRAAERLPDEDEKPAPPQI